MERRTPVRYKEMIVGEYDGDMIVNDTVLIEVKIAPQYEKRDKAQLLNVLKATGLKVGILPNFGLSQQPINSAALFRGRKR